jgi:ferric-dicitrate binding protein FerR (iron transport regulator)
MPATNNHLQSLFEKYMNNNCTKAEWEELLQLVREETHEQDLSKAFKAYWDQINPAASDTEHWNEKFRQMMQETKTSAPVVSMHKRRRWTAWIAAAVILFVVCGLWFVVSNRSQDAGHKSQVAIHDVPAPTNTRAVITLADGSKVYLDSASNGTIAQQNNVSVIKNSNGEINYTVAANSDQRTAISPVFNTLFNPRGSKVISLTLSDGTKVWLNSESSLRYPASFAPSALNREVEITGEAYFEVKHNSKQPFKVHLPNGGVIEDIGTSFNVNAYTDEADIKTTLVEGSVQLFASSVKTSAPFAFKLKPGEQAIQSAQSPNHFITTSPDLDEVTAWKNGFFQFNNTDIQTIMRQVSRWYDVNVEYNGNISKTFGGKIPRSMSAQNVFKVLEETGGVHFKIEGKKITVMK